MSEKVVAIIGTLDTKGAVCSFIKKCIEAGGANAFLFDVGIFESGLTPDMSAGIIAEAGGGEITKLREKGGKDAALPVMKAGAEITLRKLYDEGKIDGVITIGGEWGRAVGMYAMGALPIGVPKLMLSAYNELDGNDVSDILMMPSVVDIEGVNRLSAKVLSNAAGAIVGMVNAPQIKPEKEMPLVAATVFSTTSGCVTRAVKIAAVNDCQVLVFHAAGDGGKKMEALIRDGYIDGVLDITTTELADELAGGMFSAGSERLTSAGKAGIPQIVSAGAIDTVKLGAFNSIEEKFKDRKLLNHSYGNTLMRTSPEENKRLAEIISEKLNKAKGRTVFLLPKRGFSSLGDENGQFCDLEADKAFSDTMKQHLNKNIRIIELDVNINDEELAAIAVNMLVDFMDDKY